MVNLDKVIFERGMNDLVAMYPNWDSKLDKPEVMRTWYNFFKKFNEIDFIIMIESYINTEQFYPTVASLKKHRPSKLNILEMGK